jgi:hypothetical protein
LINANISLTEEAILHLLYSSKINIKGTISIIESIDNLELKQISFETKQKLVEKFGNIDSQDNVLKVNYKDWEVPSTNAIEYNTEVSIFYAEG